MSIEVKNFANDSEVGTPNTAISSKGLLCLN